jgi:hypothetical protein
MAAEIQKLTEDAGKLLKDVVGGFVKSYASCTISEQLRPKLQNAIKAALDDAKAAARGEEKEPAMPFEAKGVDEPAVAIVTLDRMERFWPWYGNEYMTYHVSAMRICKNKEGTAIDAIGRKHHVCYRHIQAAANSIKKDGEGKDAKAPALFGEWLSGTYCGCLTAVPDPDHGKKAEAWFPEVQKLQSKDFYSYFQVGDDYVAARENQHVMRLAINDLVNRQLGWWALWELRWDMPPYDLGDGVWLVMKYKLREEFRAKVQAAADTFPIAALRNKAWPTFIDSCKIVYDTAWLAAEPLVRAVGTKVQEAVGSLAAKLEDLLKSIVAKVIEAVGDKLGDKEKEEEHKVKIGDHVKAFDIEKSAVGQDLVANLRLDEANWHEVATKCDDRLGKASKEAVEKSIQATLGDKLANHAIMKLASEHLSKWITTTVEKITCMKPVLSGLAVLAQHRNNLEAKVKAAATAEERQKLLLAASGEMWKAMPAIALASWKSVEQVKRNIDPDYGNDLTQKDAKDRKVDKDGKDPTMMVRVAQMDAVNTLFISGIRGLNAVRVNFTEHAAAALAGAADGAAAAAAVRAAFVSAVTGLAPHLLGIGWAAISKAVVGVAVAICLWAFETFVWGLVKAGLEALAALLPDVLKTLGLDPVEMGRTTCYGMIEKKVTSMLTSTILDFERHLFG